MRTFWNVVDLILAGVLCIVFLPIYLVLELKEKLSGDDPE